MKLLAINLWILTSFATYKENSTATIANLDWYLEHTGNSSISMHRTQSDVLLLSTEYSLSAIDVHDKGRTKFKVESTHPQACIKILDETIVRLDETSQFEIVSLLDGSKKLSVDISLKSQGKVPLHPVDNHPCCCDIAETSSAISVLQNGNNIVSITEFGEILWSWVAPEKARYTKLAFQSEGLIALGFKDGNALISIFDVFNGNLTAHFDSVKLNVKGKPEFYTLGIAEEYLIWIDDDLNFRAISMNDGIEITFNEYNQLYDKVPKRIIPLDGQFIRYGYFIMVHNSGADLVSIFEDDDGETQLNYSSIGLESTVFCV
jgi:hypothetical protein